MQIRKDDLAQIYSSMRMPLVRYCKKFYHRGLVFRRPDGEKIKADGEDNVQEHFVRLLEQLAETGDYFHNLFKGVQNTAIDETRRIRDKARKLETAFPEKNNDEQKDSPIYTDSGPTVLQNLITEENLKRYAEAIDAATKEFTPQMWKIIALYLQDYDYGEIADQLQIKPITVRKEFYKAVDRFRTAFKKFKLLPTK